MSKTVLDRTSLEAAALIGVVTAAIAGSVYALGTVAHMSYLYGLGFDAHQFPPLGAELYVIGFAYSLLPALFVGLLALAYASAFAFSSRAADWLNRHPTPAKWRIPVALVGIAVGAGFAYYDPGTLKQWITAAIIFVIIMVAAIMLGKWVPTVAMSCYIGAVIAPLMIQHIGSEAYEAGQKRAAEAGNNHATTMIVFTDGHKIPAPGTRIVCSEHFCGFHDGTTPTVISLEGVRSISPEPQEQPPHTSDK